MRLFEELRKDKFVAMEFDTPCKKSRNNNKVSALGGEPLELNLAEVVHGFGEIENRLPMHGHIVGRVVQGRAVERGAGQAARQANQLQFVDGNGLIVALVQADEHVVLSNFTRHQHAHVQNRTLLYWRRAVVVEQRSHRIVCVAQNDQQLHVVASAEFGIHIRGLQWKHAASAYVDNDAVGVAADFDLLAATLIWALFIIEIIEPTPGRIVDKPFDSFLFQNGTDQQRSTPQELIVHIPGVLVGRKFHEQSSNHRRAVNV
ncbi:hypothetical protein T10_10399 [Trichinella papuae]|uniref:Uncharacterized protein n=1 Tax=Trichinella papuae TaxID=268474 RepID=A0A0V1N4U3_9BILA|nr:hypothetical protein T10_10399 [Trichinella papuae]